MATSSGSLEWSLYTGLTIYVSAKYINILRNNT